jgi:hypothetical protein
LREAGWPAVWDIVVIALLLAFERQTSAAGANAAQRLHLPMI